MYCISYFSWGVLYFFILNLWVSLLPRGKCSFTSSVSLGWIALCVMTVKCTAQFFSACFFPLRCNYLISLPPLNKQFLLLSQVITSWARVGVWSTCLPQDFGRIAFCFPWCLLLLFVCFFKYIFIGVGIQICIWCQMNCLDRMFNN